MLEPLSLENFDPVYAREPFLNTPRSLEACRYHGVNPEELVEIPFREFQRAYPDDPEMALRRFERVDSARKIMLESVYHKWQEICWEEENRPRCHKKKKDGKKETVIDVEEGKRLTVLELQAEKFRKVEKQQWKGLRNKLFMEMKKAVHDEQAKVIVEKQDNIGDNALLRRRELDLERQRKMKADLEEADRKEKEMAQQIRAEQKAAMLEAKAKIERDKKNVRRAKRAQLRRERERLAREEYINAQKHENYIRFRNEAIERTKQLDKQERELAQRMQRERKKKEQQDHLKKMRTLNRLKGAKEELAKQAELKRKKVSQSIDEFDEKIEKLRKEKRDKWKKEFEKNSGKSEAHLQQVKATNREITEAKINSTLSDLEKRDELARQVMAENEEQRNRRRAIKEVRQQSFELAAIRRKKAMEFRKQKLEESIKAKDERYKAIKDGEKALKKMTESMTEVISKTKMEIASQVDRLNSKDILTVENVMTKVHEHNDTTLFPRLRNRFSQLPDDEDHSPCNTVDMDKNKEFQNDKITNVSNEQLQKQDEDISAEKGNNSEHASLEANGTVKVENSQPESKLRGLASTLPPPSPQNRPKTDGGRLNKTMSSATTKKVILRPKSPTPAIGIKVLSKSKINETLDMMKMTLEESIAAKEARNVTPKKTKARKIVRKDSDPMNLTGKKKPWLNGDDDTREIVVDDDRDSLDEEVGRSGASLASSLEDSQNQAVDDSSNNQLSRKSTPFPGDLKQNSKKQRYDPNTNEGMFDELEEVEENEVDDDDIVARIEGTPAAKENSKSRSQTISARPLTPEGNFRPEYSRDHPLAGGKGQYAREKAAGKQKLIPGKRRPERLAEVMSKQEQKKHDLQRQLEELRKHQNEALLEVLEDERRAEEQRTSLSHGVTDTKERNRLELVFAEERKRASERIIAMTKDHEQKMKQVILAMDLGS